MYEANVVPGNSFSHPAGKSELGTAGNSSEADQRGLKVDKTEKKRLGRFGVIARETEKNATSLNRFVP
jgi:hypothetical protein